MTRVTRAAMVAVTVFSFLISPDTVESLLEVVPKPTPPTGILGPTPTPGTKLALFSPKKALTP